MEVQGSKGMELWKRAIGVATLRYGCMGLWRLATGEVTWRYGDLKVRRRRADIEVWDLEPWRRAAGVQTWRHRALELEARGGPGDVEA